jgi:hypothetical protein
VRILLDTNVLPRLANPADAEYAMVRGAVNALSSRGDELCFVAQNLVEFWNACTRPAERNGFGLAAGEGGVLPPQFQVEPRRCDGRFPLR